MSWMMATRSQAVGRLVPVSWPPRQSLRRDSLGAAGHTLLCLHLRPINQVVFLGPYFFRGAPPAQLAFPKEGEVPRRVWQKCHYSKRKPLLGVGFALRCLQRLSDPDVATQRLLLAEQLVHPWSVHPGPLVLGTAPRKFPTPTTDRDRTVSRRSEPSSRTALMGEQPNPWDRIQPQDATSRHRGAKQRRRYGRLGAISLLSPE